jgi:hypothetical protein
LGDLWKELSDWNNLLQGALGNLVGSLLGILGAYLLAVRTIQGQLKADRQLLREQEGVAAAGRVRAQLEEISQRLFGLLIGPIDHADADNSASVELAASINRLRDIQQELDPALPELLAARLRMLPAALTWVVFQPLTGHHPDVRDVESRYLVIVDLMHDLDLYRRDPLKTLRRLRKRELSQRLAKLTPKRLHRSKRTPGT